jgi:hypothetical protein
MQTKSAVLMRAPAKNATRSPSASLFRRTRSPAREDSTRTAAPRWAAGIPARHAAERGSAAGSPVALQRKLAIGAVNDPLEHEADRVAEQVMRMPASATVLRGSPLQLSRKCATCEDEEKGKLQKKSAGDAAIQTAPPIVHDVLASPGEPLAASTRAFMEPRFGYDFSRVRVHSGAAAARSAQAVNALAYTVGDRIVLDGAGASPRLLAHELAHVVQQNGAAPTLRREEKTVGGSLDLKPDPCVFVPGLDDPLCGQKAVSLCEESPGIPGCSVVCKVLGCKKPDKPTTACKPGARAATSSDFAGQCCVGIGESAQNCCPPERLAAKPIAHCCNDDETVDPSTDTCIKVKDIPVICPPEQQTTRGECCFRPMVPKGEICAFPDIPGPTLPQPPTPLPTPQPPTPQFGTLWTDTIHFKQDHPAPGESDPDRILTAEGRNELDSVQRWLTPSSDLQVRLIAHASSEGETAYNQRLSERRVNFIAGKVAGRLAEPIVPDLATAGCTSLGTGMWACGESMADQSSASAEDRVVRVTFMRNTLPKIQVPPVQLPPRLPPKSTPGLGE